MPSFEEFAPQAVLSIRARVMAAEIGSELAKLLPEAWACAEAQGAKVSGMPFTRYHDVTDDYLDVEAGVPVAARVDGAGRVKASELPGGRAVVLMHHGPYTKLIESYKTLEEFLGENDLSRRGGPWDVYLNDPGSEPDPSKWQTKIVQPIE